MGYLQLMKTVVGPFGLFLLGGFGGFVFFVGWCSVACFLELESVLGEHLYLL